MNEYSNMDINIDSTNRISDTVGFYSSMILALVTIVTFGFALIAVPISGANAPDGGLPYPYLDTLKQFPKDYLWMFLAIVLVLSYVVFMVSINSTAKDTRKIFGQIGVAFAVIAAAILIMDYFIQIAVIPVSLTNNETEGISLITQYNPHGLFIALEELGYIMMSTSFLFMVPIFKGKTRLEFFIRWIFIVSFVSIILSLVVISIQYGIDRKDRFEVTSLSVSWLVLIVNGILMSVFFKKRLKKH